MIEIASETQLLLTEYEKNYRIINLGTNPKRQYLGNDKLIERFNEISSAEDADIFFEDFGVGNATHNIHNPYERQDAYELLLKILQVVDPEKFLEIHKGTPYYFIGWTSFQHRDFAKAMFYMDAAVSEDMKFIEVANKNSTRPSLDFFLLKSNHGPSALATNLLMVEIMNKVIESYNSSGLRLISIDQLRSQFVEVLLYAGANSRSILTALYTFILEYGEKEKQIRLRSSDGGSIQPFIDHLFDGARILESLFELRGADGVTLKPKILSQSAIAVSNSALQANKTLADAEQIYQQFVDQGKSFQDCNFASAYIIRNTTGHSLLWPDQFSEPTSYELLYSHLVNSIFWTIEKLWL